jgi:MOSC domain-containing protein YiiM
MSGDVGIVGFVGFVRAVLIGSVRSLGPTVSGIDKHPTVGPQRVEAGGFVGDEQADRRVHGGEDKAVLCYAWEHYQAWRTELPGCPLLDSPGAFGENLSIERLDEHHTCIGDRYRIGSALFAVTQGRQPCFKLNLRFGVPDMAARVQATLRAGWYLRVLEPGMITAGDRIELVDRPNPSHTVGDLLAVIRDREVDPDRLASILELPLTPSWRRLFERRLHSGGTEDWKRRMTGE